MKKSTIIIALTSIVMLLPGKHTVSFPGSMPSALLDQEIKKHRTPSVQYLFFSDKEILYQYSEGYAHAETRLKVDANTTFNAYSITKTFTALAILQLAEKGLLDIDKPVSNYLPLPALSPNTTIKHLLSHTAGVANPLPLSWIHLAEEHDRFDRNRFFNELFNRITLQKAEPGKRFAYSNLGYVVLGRLIETVTGQTYEAYVQEHIIDKLPLQSGELGFTIPHPLLHATGYHRKHSFTGLLLGFLINKARYMRRAVGKWLPFKPHYVNGTSYGGLIGTSNAFARFGMELLKEDSHLISTDYKQMMFAETATDRGKPTGMCLGWFSGSLQGNDYRMHAGGGGGYYCELRLYPHLKAGSFVAFNRSGFKNERYADKIDPYFLKLKVESDR